MGFSDWFSLTQLLQVSSLAQVPMLGLARPKVIELSESTARVRLPLNFLTKNHVGSMYFGVLAMGAELAIALRVVERIAREECPVTFIFKDFRCEFPKRAETDIDFICDEVQAVNALIEKALQTGERVDQTFSGRGVNRQGEEVLIYQITLSIKRKGGSKKRAAEKG